MFLADDVCFRTLEASLQFLVLFWLMGLNKVRLFGRHRHLCQVVAVRSSTTGGDGTAFLNLDESGELANTV